MKVTNEYYLCPDCFYPAVYDDYTALDYYFEEGAPEKYETIQNGLDRLGIIFPTDDSTTIELSTIPCDCCGTTLAGDRSKFITLED